MNRETTWIECSKPSCGKWRIVSDEVAKRYENLSWTCEMNEDRRYDKCSEPEQEIDVSKGEKVVLTKIPYKNGEIIMAKLSGYCSWPALICPDPSCELYYDAILNDKDEEDEITHIHVEFFGSPKSHAWVTPSNISPFCATKSRIHNTKMDKPHKVKKWYQLAMDEAECALSLSCEERLRNCTFKTIEDLSKQNGKGPRRLKRERNSSKMNVVSDEKQFLCKYEQFLAEWGSSRIRPPVWSGMTVSLYEIFQIVQNHGGYIEVTKRRKWLSLRDNLLQNHDPLVKPSGNLKLFYERNMVDFEIHWRRMNGKGIKRSKLQEIKPVSIKQNTLRWQSKLPIPTTEICGAEDRNARNILVETDLVPGGSDHCCGVSSPSCNQNVKPSCPSTVGKYCSHSRNKTSSRREDHNLLLEEHIDIFPDLNCTQDNPPILNQGSRLDSSTVEESSKLLGSEFVPSSNPASPRAIPMEEELDDDCGISMRRELEELKIILENLETTNEGQEAEEHVEHRDLSMKNNRHSLDNEVNDAIREIFELEENISRMEETTELDFLTR